MDFSQNTIVIEVTPSKFVRCHSVSVENTLIRRHSVGPGSKPQEEQVWRGDHAFNSDAASFSLLNFIEPEIEAANPYLSKKEAHALALEKFNDRLKQDLAFEHQENSHIDTTVHWTVIDGKDGKKELATTYGNEMITLSQLWDHTRTYAEHVGNPLAYNREEERAQLLMQDAFIEGKANGFVSVISHPDAIRYVQVWERTSTGDIASKQIDLYATTGRDFTHAEGQVLVQGITKYHESHGTSKQYEDVAYAHALFTSGVTSVEDVRTIAIAHVVVDSRAMPILVDMTRGIMAKTAHDIRETTILLGKDFHAYVQKKIDGLRNRFDQPVVTKTDTMPHASLATEKDNTKNTAGREQVYMHQGIERTKNGDVLVQDILSEWVFDHSVLSMGALHEAFAHSALAMVLGESQTMIESQPHETTQTVVENEVKIHTDHDVRETIESVVLFLQKIFGQTHEVGDPKIEFIANNAQYIYREEDTRDIFSTFDQKVGSVELGILQIMQAFFFLVKESGYTNQGARLKENLTDAVDSMGVELERKEEAVVHKTISRAMFGIAIWMILQGFDSGNDRSIRPDISFGDDEVVLMDTESHETFFSTTPWVLLSIIWYLSMVKEAQMSQGAPVQKTSKKQKNISAIAFPLSGVVYLYIRDRIHTDTSISL